ncbi:hypothetical protein [Amaricoccus tamworthensis]|uniref:hypothetical protein n=1 Tax=Amaricoccus tamworthensis TaxID=57002 RepID=UPI003C7B96A0
MTNFAKSLAVAGLLTVTAAGAVSATTLGDLRASGQMSEGAFTQLIAGTDLTEAEASNMTLDEVVAERWQDD